MSDVLKRALMRFGRIVLFGGIATLTTHLITNSGELTAIGVPELVIPLAISVLAFADKFVRDMLGKDTSGN